MINVVRIRRFFSIFLLFSTVQGVISDYEKGLPLSEIIPGAVLMVIIVFFLVKPPKKKKKQLEVEDLNYEEIDEAIIIEETFDNIETSEVEENDEYLPSEDLKVNTNKKRDKK